jgi:hypothetical protein
VSTYHLFATYIIKVIQFQKVIRNQKSYLDTIIICIFFYIFVYFVKTSSSKINKKGTLVRFFNLISPNSHQFTYKSRFIQVFRSQRSYKKEVRHPIIRVKVTASILQKEERIQKRLQKNFKVTYKEKSGLQNKKTRYTE